ncbi:MAG: crossover junction endodeoxyribonuclease RuvC [Fimbriimonadaceae bacterium]|nr:crossover junction endodeoxyribonuclease RuvC [Fimbriimonadaceae bacterium]
MLVLGIDPGLERIGYGAVRREGSRLIPVEYGLIETPRIGLADRLALVHEEVSALLVRARPDAVATEKLLFSVNRKTAMDVAKSLGVILLAIARHGAPWTEYAPPEIKLSVVGNGSAEKKQVQFMVTRLLGLSVAPKPDDVSDALAIAVCHALRCRPGLGGTGV